MSKKIDIPAETKLAIDSIVLQRLIKHLQKRINGLEKTIKEQKEEIAQLKGGNNESTI